MNQENYTGYRGATTSPAPKKRKVPQKKANFKKRQLRIVAVAAVILLALLLICLRGCKTPDPLVGKWDLDGITSYEFMRNGKGRMVLPSSEYKFTYELDGETLRIDFDYDGARDAQYLITITDDELILDGGNSFTRGVYILTKQK